MSLLPDIDYASLLVDYYTHLDNNFQYLLENVVDALKAQLIQQTREFKGDPEYYEITQFQRIKNNWHFGTMYYEAECETPPVFYEGRYVSQKWAGLT